MPISDLFECANVGEEGDDCSPSAQTKKLSSSVFAPAKGGEGNNYCLSAARRLEESREAFVLSSGRLIEVVAPPTVTGSTPSYLRATSCLASAPSTSCSASTNSTASCIAMSPISSTKITSASSFLLSAPDLRPSFMSRPPRLATHSALLRQALHNSDSLRGLSPHNVRHRCFAWEMARAKMVRREHQRSWVFDFGVSSASSSSDEDESHTENSWDGILDSYEIEQMEAYEDERMIRLDHWSSRKLQPDPLDDEY